MLEKDVELSPRKPCISEETFKCIVSGDLITYLLAPEMLPVDPLREWHGRVEKVCGADVVMVTVLDEGYVGERELVKRSEILTVKSL